MMSILVSKSTLMREQVQHIDQIEQLNAQALTHMQESFRTSSKPIGVVSDIDEFLVDTVGNHIKFIHRAAGIFGHKGDLPTYEDIVAKGGTAHYAEIFGLKPEEWEEIMMRVRASRFVNRNAPRYHEAPHTILSAGEYHELHGFMTAKPGTERTLRTTKQDLEQRLGFTEKPVILRPEIVPISHSSAWKVGLLAKIAAADPAKALVLTDDSISTAKAIASHNNQQGRIQLMQVLYPGPLTKGPLERGEYVPHVEEGIFVADWEQMPEIFDIIDKTWKRLHN